MTSPTRPPAGLGERLRRIEAALLALGPEPDPLRRVARLRQALGEELGREAALLAELRRRAEGRLPDAGRLLLDPRRLEQATHRTVAAARAQRIAALGPGTRVLDATAGLGGDALLLAGAGLDLVAADADEPTARRLAWNLASAGLLARVLVARAEAPAARADMLVLDPDRRSAPPTGAGHEGRRRLGPEEASPPLETCVRLAADHAGASVKLAPGTDPARVEEAASGLARRSLQWVSLGGELRELGLWTGALAHPDGPALREVLLLAEGAEPRSWAAAPARIVPLAGAAAEEVAWIVEPDPAVVRAGLVGTLGHALGLAPLGPEIAYLGGAGPVETSFGRGFRVLGSAPLDRRRVRALLARHDVGRLVVKKRGHPDTAEVLAARLAGRGSRTGLLLVTRLADSHRAFLVESAP